MGSGVHEGPSAGQSKRKSPNNCSGDIKKLTAFVVIKVHNLSYLGNQSW